eukprot:jgi/Mesvir1/18383/Mv14265-RA.1
MALGMNARKVVQFFVVCQEQEEDTLKEGFASFFFLLTAYFILLPVRDDAGISLGTSTLPSLFLASLVATAMGAPASSYLLSYPSLKKRQALRMLFRFFAISLVVFCVLHTLFPRLEDTARTLQEAKLTELPHLGFFAVRALFFVWASLLNLLLISALWARLADVLSPEAGARLFGFIGAGATLGQVAGSLVVALLSSTGPELLLISAVFLEVAARRVSSMGPDDGATDCCGIMAPNGGEGGTSVPPSPAITRGPSPRDDPAIPRTASFGELRNPLLITRNKMSHGGAGAEGGGSSSAAGTSAGGSIGVNSKVVPLVGAEGELLTATPAITVVEPPGWMDSIRHSVRGLQMIQASRYLQHVCVHLFLSAVISSLFYFEKAYIVATIPDSATRMAMFARISGISGLCTLLIQVRGGGEWWGWEGRGSLNMVKLTGHALTTMGVGAVLASTPALAMVCMSILFLFSHPSVLMLTEAVRKVAQYSLARPARETLFTVVSREEKYSAKIFIDTVVQRMGDATAAALVKMLSEAVTLEPFMIAAGAVPICAVWSVVAIDLGKRQNLLARAKRSPGAEDSTGGDGVSPPPTG